MYCPSCGTENPDNAEYCINCGKKLTSEKEKARSGFLTASAALTFIASGLLIFLMSFGTLVEVVAGAGTSISFIAALIGTGFGITAGVLILRQSHLAISLIGIIVVMCASLIVGLVFSVGVGMASLFIGFGLPPLFLATLALIFTSIRYRDFA